MVANHPGMTDQTNSNLPRDGAPKRTQTKFPVKPGMTDRVAQLSYAGPANPGVGPDADPANPLSPEPKSKHQNDTFKASWGMRDANGQSVNGELGKAVLAEAANLGR